MKRNYNKFYNNEPEKEETKEFKELVKEKEEIEKPIREEVKTEESKEDKFVKKIGRLINTERLNVRAIPNGDVVKIINKDQTVTIIDESNPEWYKISEPVEGYVMKEFIQA